MKRFILVDDFIEELNTKYKGQTTDFCLTPLDVENWLNNRAMSPVQLLIYSKERPDPELDGAITHLRKVYTHFADLQLDPIKLQALHKALRYLEQLRLLKGEYARVFFEESKSPE